MSFTDAIGRIDSIIALQQQILDPAAATTSTTTSSDGGASLTGSSGTGSTTFATALAQAQAASTESAIDPTSDTDPATGLDSATSLESLLAAQGTTTSGVGATGVTSSASGVVGAGATSASTTAPAQVQAMVDEADSLVGKPYVWGGGHSGWGAQSGYDCSGFVSAVLHAGGYLSSPQDTETLPSAAGMESGPGQYVTVYDRTTPGQEGHVIIDIAGQFYESGGESGSWGGGGGVEKISTPTASYLATFNTVLHPEGL
jgi:cell wall-associated NlpC family hydrolase